MNAVRQRDDGLEEALRLLDLRTTVKPLYTPKGRIWYEFLDKDEHVVFIAKNMPIARAFLRGMAYAKKESTGEDPK